MKDLIKRLDHAPGCDGQEYSKLQAVSLSPALPVAEAEGQEVVVVRMDWCGKCTAAEWDYV